MNYLHGFNCSTFNPVPNETKQCQTDLRRATARSRERYVILQDLVGGDLMDIHVII